MPVPAPSPQAREAFDELAEGLVAVAGARTAQMMGRPMLAVGRRMAVCLDGDVLGVRLGAGTPAYVEALAVPGAEVFSPGESRRSFTDWVALPLAQADRWADLAAAAVERLRSGQGRADGGSDAGLTARARAAPRR